MYAPISTLLLDERDGALVGYAAPAGGPAPCLLRLMADGIPIAAARATRYAPAARAKSIRLGWCGVRLPGLAMASAVGRTLDVRCGVSDRVVWQRMANAPLPGPGTTGRMLTVFEIIALSRAEDQSPSLTEIRPIMEQHLRQHGEASFVNATYETFLGRPVDAGSLPIFLGNGDDLFKSTVETVLGSMEYRAKPVPFIPGPFNAAFRYDLDALSPG